MLTPAMRFYARGLARPSFGLLLGGLTIAASAQAQTSQSNEVKIPQVVVTAPNAPKKPKAPQVKKDAAQTAPQQAAPQPDQAKLRQTPGGIGNPGGQIVTNIDGARVEDTRAFTVNDILKDSPGVSVKQGNGPRDLGISIRGSNARNGFGIRNIQVFEDGFPVTQPDGLSRSDLIDPHAYSGVDVYRGPSSVLFGNYATGGAINFRSWRGGDINGVTYGAEGGSFGYLNNYVIAGAKGNGAEASVFMSDVRGNGYIGYSSFNTQTLNALATADISPRDTITVKVIDNQLFGELPIRLSLNQYKTNPYQQGCERAATAAAGCGTISLFKNGFSSADGTLAQSASEAGLHRDDRRTILGTRWEHSFDNNTVLRTQFVFDDRNINQPTGTTSAIGDFPSYNVMSDLIAKGSLFGFRVNHLTGVYYNTLTWSSDTVNLMPGGNATLGRLASNVSGTHTNAGVHAREEVEINRFWTVALGANLESTSLTGANSAYSYSGAGGSTTTINRLYVDREFWNSAREAAVIFRPANDWQIQGRVATAYGTPQLGNLFVTPAGVDGDNTQLKPQTNLGYDLGVEWRPSRATRLSVTGFYEFFEDELVTQSPGAGLKSFTFNAPASEHRGIEIAAEIGLTPQWRLMGAYTLNDQIYTEYVERLSAGTQSTAFNRAGNKIPGVSPNELVAQIRYDKTDGLWKGFGGFFEYQWKDAFFMDNGNLLKAPGYDLFNVNLHYDTKFEYGPIKKLGVFFEVRNILDKTYVASANNISNSISSTTGAQNPSSVLANSTGSIYAGAPRTFVTGVKVSF